MTRPNGLPDDVPEPYYRSVAAFQFSEAVPMRAATFDAPVLVRSSAPSAAAWAAINAKANAVREMVRSHNPSIVREAPQPQN
jgi:hypothetical protein